MKSSTCLLALAIAAVLIGCESLPTDPAGSPATAGPGLAKGSYQMVRIPLSGLVREPYPNSGLVYDINGFVDYSMVRVTGCLFDLHLAANATLTPRSDKQQSLDLAVATDYRVTVSEEGVAIREVRYLFPGRNDRLALFMTLQITQCHVEVTDMHLDFME